MEPSNLIKELDDGCYKWLRYWRQQETSGEYGEAYRKYRIILIALKLKEKLLFSTMSKSEIRRVPRRGGETINLEQLWEHVRQASGDTSSYKTFQTIVSTINTAREAMKTLTAEKARRNLSAAEEQRYNIIRLMLRKEPIAAWSSLGDASDALEGEVNRMSARKFVSYAYGESS